MNNRWFSLLKHKARSFDTGPYKLHAVCSNKVLTLGCVASNLKQFTEMKMCCVHEHLTTTTCVGPSLQ